jgi:hypothetical protein
MQGQRPHLHMGTLEAFIHPRLYSYSVKFEWCLSPTGTGCLIFVCIRLKSCPVNITPVSKPTLAGTFNNYNTFRYVLELT